jgi:hypothetical protein
MWKAPFGVLELCFWQCSELKQGTPEDIAALFRFMRNVGGEILTFARDRVHPNPHLEANSEGCIMDSLGFGHALLEQDPMWPKKYSKGTAGLSYLNDNQVVILSQSGQEKRSVTLDSQANGMLALGLLLYPFLHPKFGWIDELGNNSPTEKSIEATELKYIFWANFFGPEYVNKYSRAFLLNAPGWRKEELDDGGILYVVGESYFDWWKYRFHGQEILDYFHTEMPNVKLYRSRGVR